MKRIADTGLVVALLACDDPAHEWALDAFRHHAPFHTCDLVIGEAASFFPTPEPVLQLLVRGDLVLDPDFCLAQELQRVLVLTAKYANRPMDPGPTGLMCVNALHPSRKDHTAMSRYISLLQFTEQGSKNIKKSTARAHAFDKLAAKAGVKVEGQYWTMGNYDGVLVLSADSEQKVLHLLTELASLGNVRTSTMQAFGDDEFDQIVGRK